MLEPASGEYDDVLIEDITGALPDDLLGTLYRSAPVRWEAGGFYAQHLFDGDGMVAKFTLRGGTLRYRNRYVRTPKFKREEQGRGAQVRALGTQGRGGILGNAGRLPADRANTTSFYHAERLVALSDDGRPWEMDPDTLSTVGRCDFDGALSVLSTFSPHPKLDPRTGEAFNFGLTVPPMGIHRAAMGLRCYRINAQGAMTTIRTVGLRHLTINHDFGLTERYLVFVLDPLVIAGLPAVRAGLGMIDFNSATAFRDDLGSEVLLVPRDGGEPRRFTIPAFAKVHVNNAFEDGNDVVIDVVRYADWNATAAMLSNFRASLPPRGGTLTRLRISPTNRVEFTELSSSLGEFPMHDWRRTTRQFRYSYLMTSDGCAAPELIKIDGETGTQTAYNGFAEGDGVGEPIFVPRSADSAEDDGWLLFVTYLAAEHRSALYVLDARDLQAGPVALARLPHHFFPGFHGMFTPRVSSATATA
ncbi:carotenoid oxygenase family protein [Mycobacterium sp. PDNC021]|uniref:carotenoid oxygenase family protein n=1 Tax=Mycobacterium sp. PDNC021 TaxID=3391399 RepID=UPI003AB0EEEC